MSNIGKVVISPLGQNIGKVSVRPYNRTTIAAPNFEPRLNVSIEDINSVNVETKTDGDLLVYNSESGEYISTQLTSEQIKNINGGSF